MPQFPFRRSIPRQLRERFAHDRLAAQAPHLGYSSLSPGEGAAEVLDANDNVIAQFGHAAGRSGFLLPRGSGWQTVQEWAAEEIASGTSGIASRVSTLEGRADSHASRIGAAEGRLDAHATRLGRHENDMEAIDGKLVNAYNALEDRVANLEGKSGNPINPTPIVKG